MLSPRGVTQGDPASGSMWALAMDPLLRDLRKRLRKHPGSESGVCADDVGLVLSEIKALPKVHGVFTLQRCSQEGHQQGGCQHSLPTRRRHASSAASGSRPPARLPTLTKSPPPCKEPAGGLPEHPDILRRKIHYHKSPTHIVRGARCRTHCWGTASEHEP